LTIIHYITTQVLSDSQKYQYLTAASSLGLFFSSQAIFLVNKSLGMHVLYLVRSG